MMQLTFILTRVQMRKGFVNGVIGVPVIVNDSSAIRCDEAINVLRCVNFPLAIRVTARDNYVVLRTSERKVSRSFQTSGLATVESENPRLTRVIVADT